MNYKRIKYYLLGRISRNVLFWLLYTLWHFQSRSNIAAWYWPLLVHIVLFYGSFCYINTLWLIPRFLLRRKYLQYTLSAIALILLNSLVSKYTSDIFNVMYPGVNFMGATPTPWYIHTIAVVWTHIVVALGKFIADSIEKQAKLEQLQQQRLESELAALRSQINPHFLFNALNTIYGMSRKADPLTPDAILKLSDILRHNLYECDSAEISLEREIFLLQQYIELTKLRLHNKESITLELKTQPRQQKIAPLILVPFVENAIKHGLGNMANNAWVDIQLQLSGDTLIFCCSNGYRSTHAGGSLQGGIGLANVKRRLELLYPQKHRLSITDKNETFSVRLELQLDNAPLLPEAEQAGPVLAGNHEKNRREHVL